MKSFLPVAALKLTMLTVLIVTSGCVGIDAQGHIVREEKHFDVSGVPDVRLATYDGSIEIRSWGKPQVQIQIEKRGPTEESVQKLEVTATQNGSRIDVEAKKPSGDFVIFGIGHMTPTARLVVTLPRASNISGRSGDGSIRITGVEGTLDLRTSDGSIRASDVSGALTLNTRDGSVTLNGAEGTLDLDTGDGGVDVSGKLGVVKVHTGDGSITFRAESGTTMSGDWSLTTGDGGVTVYLPAEFGADLDAHTGDGRIHTELKLTAQDGGEIGRHTVRARLGGGGRALRIRTGDGSINLR